MDFFPISVPKKDVFKSKHAEKEEEDENGGLSLLLSQQPIEGDENSEWLSVFVEDCFSTSANYHLVPTTTETSAQIPVETLKPKQLLNPKNPRKKRKKKPKLTTPIIKHKTPSFFDLDHFITELNADVDPPLLDQAHWLADSEPIFPIKHEPFTIKDDYIQPKPEKDKDMEKEKKKVLKHRKCTHCQTEKTPLWRQGPSGKGTLCNACGVRWLKSGNLFPEYRPANSPTFVSDLHSNVLRKVLEMREAGKAASGGSSSS